MKFDPILIINGEPNSVFSEILFKSLKKIKIKKPIIIISSYKLLKIQMKKLKYNFKIRLIDHKKLNKYEIDNKSINLINIDINQTKPFDKISKKSNRFIRNSFKLAFNLIKREKIKNVINGPISKKYFLNNKYLGITEFISNYFSKKNTCMLIYNKNLSVVPLTTHLPLKFVCRKINQGDIQKKIELIDDFYTNYINIKPRIGVTGLNPHCESVHKFNEDDKIIKPIIKKLKKKGL